MNFSICSKFTSVIAANCFGAVHSQSQIQKQRHIWPTKSAKPDHETHQYKSKESLKYAIAKTHSEVWNHCPEVPTWSTPVPKYLASKVWVEFE